MEALLAGFADSLTLSAVGFVSLGVLIGYVVGVLPGLSRPTALAVAVPLTYYMSPLAGIAFLIGISKASGAGGAITAILMNVPGEPNAAATCLDGYPLARQGKAHKALTIALYGSVIGDLFATVVLIIIAAPFAKIALAIGPVELSAILLFALTFIAGLSGPSLLKGLIAGALGLFLATVGLDIETATPRLTFGFLELSDGVPIMAIAIGILGLSEMILQIEDRFMGRESQAVHTAATDREKGGLTWNEFKGCLRTILRSCCIGTGIGVLPGLGATVATFAAYAAARRASTDPDSFGKGNLEGVAAAETADNAHVPASLIPLFALGLPSSLGAAILIGAFMVHGIAPGPLMFQRHARLIYGIYAAMLITSLVILVVGRIGLEGFALLARVPTTIITPIIIFLCVAGSYMEGSGMFGVYLMFGVAVFGYLLRKLDFSFVTLLIGFLIGPMFELSLRQSIIITHGNARALLDHPVAVAFLLLTVLSAWHLGRRQVAAPTG